ncbi:lactam utilization protein LamB [Saccharibacillus sp. O23]|uniref:LamB/YcsF family protein n=1 Tax=Saccharibacillus sp. O23 TaxID=2009338 RepID=UPI000B4E542A|nr:5-oxoprolinase subunit PxpA [Saccharibacillus sp. O23]OWR28457.1 lactam utilization protein LamB [Saccharibacillus sp. O23]
MNEPTNGRIRSAEPERAAEAIEAKDKRTEESEHAERAGDQSRAALDLNCDLGESFGAYSLGRDAEILPYVTSANIACGFHAGDPSVMRRTVRLALEAGVAIGAHPGLPDLVGFGRRNMDVSAEDVFAMTLYQIGALEAIARAEGGSVRHVKPHGALYNMAAVRRDLAEAIAEAVYRANPALTLFGLANSELTRAAGRLGLRAAHEAFADRGYLADGTLMPRGLPGALIADAEVAASRVVRMALEERVRTPDGQDVPLRADTFCLHGDGEHALLFASKIRAACEAAGIEVRAV